MRVTIGGRVTVEGLQSNEAYKFAVAGKQGAAGILLRGPHACTNRTNDLLARHSSILAKAQECVCGSAVLCAYSV